MNTYQLSKRLIEEYLKKDYFAESCANRKAMIIANDLARLPGKVAGRDDERMDYFKGRINNIVDALKTDTIKISSGKSWNFPTHSFDIFKYDEESVFLFIKAFIEEQTVENNSSGSYNKYKYESKVDVERDNIFVCNILKHKPDNRFNYTYDEKIFKKEYNRIRREFKEICLEKAKVNNFDDIINKDLKTDNLIQKNCYFFWIPEQYVWMRKNWSKLSIQDRTTCLMVIYHFGFMVDECLQIFNSSYDFRISWKLFVWICVQTIDKLWEGGNYIISEDRVNVMLEKLQKLEEKTSCNESTEPEKSDVCLKKNMSNDIFDDFYLHNLYLIIRDELAKEFECVNILSENTEFKRGKVKHYPLPDKFVFYNNEKKNLGEKEKKIRFSMGIDDCSLETFNRRIEFCEKFIDTYNKKAERQLDRHDNRVLRAVYRTMYIDEISYDRKNMRTIAKHLINNDNLTEHYICGSAISSMLITEYRNGEEYIVIRQKCINILYRIAFNTFVEFCPYPQQSIIDNNMCCLKGRLSEVWGILYEGFGSLK